MIGRQMYSLGCVDERPGHKTLQNKPDGDDCSCFIVRTPEEDEQQKREWQREAYHEAAKYYWSDHALKVERQSYFDTWFEKQEKGEHET